MNNVVLFLCASWLMSQMAVAMAASLRGDLPASAIIVVLPNMLLALAVVADIFRKWGI